ncbi:MAG: MerR family transcriptional regulator [Hyphomicrobiaceae bacterium]|jgi:DNA-binding transcriptional MerR regulator
MPKAAEAFRTISEVADELDVPKHVLRFWELRFPQIKPMKRGGGRRYYRPADVELLRGIRHLLHAQGYTIKGVQKILREQGVEQVKDAGKPDGSGDHLPVAIAAIPAAAPDGVVPPAAKRGRKVVVATQHAAADGRAPAGRPAAPQPVDPAVTERMALQRLLGELQACRVILAGAGPSVAAVRRRRSATP